LLWTPSALVRCPRGLVKPQADGAGLADAVLTGIFRELMEIEVTGTISSPKTRTRTLGSLEDTIRRLTSPTDAP
jgi:hypothetical protein